MKYLTFRVREHLMGDFKDYDTAIVFPESTSHKAVAAQIRFPIIGAGFVAVDFGKLTVTPYDRSESLNLDPHENDGKLLKQIFFPE